MENLKLDTERQNQIKSLWSEFKSKTKEEDKKLKTKKIESIISNWNKYREKIMNDTFCLDDYTNVLSTSQRNPEDGGYLCNFLERTTSKVLGSSKPGSANNFGVKLNENKTTHYIKDENNAANAQEAEKYFNKNIKGLFKSIVSETDLLRKIDLVENANYSAKQILMKLAVLDNLNDFIYIYSESILYDLYKGFF